jgi:hypothetical protein
MQPLTPQARQQLQGIAQRYGVSTEAAESLLDSVQRGGGSMAQFNHPELGGYGQWMRGGMTMVGDMFNHGLKATVDGLCNELSRLLDSQPFEASPPMYQGQSQGGGGFQAQGMGYSGFPAELGSPSSSGSQNGIRYAVFPGTRRLAIEQNGAITIYDTLDHQIGGVSQQQGGNNSLAFTSQYGTIDLRQLPIISGADPTPSAPTFHERAPQNAPAYAPQNAAAYAPQNAPAYAPQNAPTSAPLDNEQDVFSKIERLAALKERGVISEAEFATKKAELLARI